MIQICISFFTAAYHIIYLKIFKNSFEDIVDFEGLSMFYLFFIRFGNWILITGNFIPISLLITLDMAKYFQCSRMENNRFFHSMVKDDMGIETGRFLRTVCNTTTLNEDLGQINHIFSDKTGTLTKNEMEFNRLIVGSKVLCKKTPEEENSPFILKKKKVDKNLVGLLKDKSEDGELSRYVLKCLTVCHEAFFDEENNISTSSSEEKCIIDFIKQYNYDFLKPEERSDETKILQIKEKGVLKKVELLQKFEFTSERKRNSIIIREGNDIFLFVKGADDIVEDFLKENYANYMDNINDEIDIASNEGHRVLSLGYKRINQEEYFAWEKKYNQVSDIKMKKELIEEIESEIILIGAVVLEDKLVDNIIEDIQFITSTGINFWILSGDKIDPVFSTAQSLKIITEDTEIIYFDDINKTTEKHFDEIKKRLEGIPPTKAVASVVTSKYFGVIQKYEKTNQILFYKFLEIILTFKFAIWSRLSPIQKGLIVKIVREAKFDSRCLAIGDGLNDVNMLSSAHVGVSIEGVKNKYSHTSRAADFKIPEFRTLIPLMFCFGRECYRKNAQLVLFNFQKSMWITFPQFWFGFFNYFGGQTLYHPYLYQLYNIIFTIVPIILYAIFDTNFPNKKFLFSNILYKTGLDSFYFNTKRYLITMLIGFLFSLNIMLVTIAFFDYGNYKEGAFYGFWNFGNMVFLAVLIIANFKVLFLSNSYSLLYIFSAIAGILLYILLWFIFSNVPDDDLYQSFKELTENHHLYLFLIIIGGLVVIEYLFTIMDYSLYEMKYIPKIQVDYKDIQKYTENKNNTAHLDGDLSNQKKEETESVINHSYFSDND